MSARYGIEYGCPRCGRTELVMCPYDRKTPALWAMAPPTWKRHPKAPGRTPRDWYCPDCAPLIVAYEEALQAWQDRHREYVSPRYEAVHAEDRAWREANPMPEAPPLGEEKT